MFQKRHKNSKGLFTQKFKRKKFRWKMKTKSALCRWRCMLSMAVNTIKSCTYMNSTATVNPSKAAINDCRLVNKKYIHSLRTNSSSGIVLMYLELQLNCMQKQQAIAKHPSIAQLFWLLVCCSTLTTCVFCQALTHSTTTINATLSPLAALQPLLATTMPINAMTMDVYNGNTSLLMAKISLDDRVGEHASEEQRRKKQHWQTTEAHQLDFIAQRVFRNYNIHKYNPLPKETSSYIYEGKNILQAYNRSTQGTYGVQTSITETPMLSFDNDQNNAINENYVQSHVLVENIVVLPKIAFSDSEHFRYDSIVNVSDRSTLNYFGDNADIDDHVNDKQTFTANGNMSSSGATSTGVTQHFSTTESPMLINLVMDGLGLTKLPDMAKVNISQQEYASKYREYLNILLKRQRRETQQQHAFAPGQHQEHLTRQFQGLFKNQHGYEPHEPPLHLLSITSKITARSSSAVNRKSRRKRHSTGWPNGEGGGVKRKKLQLNRVSSVLLQLYDQTWKIENDRVHKPRSIDRPGYRFNSITKRSIGGKLHDSKLVLPLYFPLQRFTVAGEIHADDVEEANVRLLIVHSPALAMKHRSRHNAQMRNGAGDRDSRLGVRHQQICPDGGDTAENDNSVQQQQQSNVPSQSVKNGPTAHNRLNGCNGRSRGRVHTRRPMLNLKVYQRLANGRRLWLDGRKLDISITGHNKKSNEEVKAVSETAGEYDEDNQGSYKESVEEEFKGGDHMVQTYSQWLQFDVTAAVKAWLRAPQHNYGLEFLCDNCWRLGARVLSGSGVGSIWESDYDEALNDTVISSHTTEDDKLMPALNVIGKFGMTRWHSGRWSGAVVPTAGDSDDVSNATITPSSGGAAVKNHHTNHQKHHLKNACNRSANQRCCRHRMDVVFKELKGFEFIIQPKVFDAGYCYGRCPPRYNPAHHHAMLQSLIWKQNRHRAPRPCCAPSKLVELEVLHVDEKDSEKLKISTWADMRVVDCACS